ncbi:MAG: T9SS type A sorting domain-containing protein [Bacteroidia bacterium]
MKTQIFFLCFMFIAFCLFAQTTKKRNSTTMGGPHDDPGKVVTFCIKDNITEKIYIEMDNAFCPGYLMNKNVNSVSISNTTLLQVMSIGNDSVFNNKVYIPITIHANPLIVNSLDRLVTVKLTFFPTQNATLACSYSKMTLKFRITQTPCDVVEDTFDTGKCNSCRNVNNVTTTLAPIKYVHFTAVNNYPAILFTPEMVGFQGNDSLIWRLGNGDSVIYSKNVYYNTNNNVTTLANGQIRYDYPTNGTFQVQCVMKCAGLKDCRYVAKREVFVLNGNLPAMALGLTLSEVNILQKSISLRWSLNDEALYGNDFRIEHAWEGGNWEVLGTTKERYFEHKNLQYGKHRYRIIYIDIEGNELALSNEETMELGGLTLYPNPVKDILYLDIEPEKRTAQLRLRNSAGLLIQAWEFIPNEINMSELAEGIYFIEIFNESGSPERKKVVKW